MNARQELFLAQSRAVFKVFAILRKNEDLPHCHALHHLQMATELLGKAYAWGRRQPKLSHRSLVPLLKTLITNTNAQSHLGYSGKTISGEVCFESGTNWQ